MGDGMVGKVIDQAIGIVTGRDEMYEARPFCSCAPGPPAAPTSAMWPWSLGGMQPGGQSCIHAITLPRVIVDHGAVP